MPSVIEAKLITRRVQVPASVNVYGFVSDSQIAIALFYIGN